MAMVNADVVALQMERVRTKLPELFETSNTASAMIKRGAETEQISTRDYRIPFIYQRGGKYRKYDPDGGDLGLGSGPKAAYMVATYFPTVYAVELTDLAMFATATSERAVKKAFAYTLANTMKEFQVYDDFAFHTAGNGVFATATAATGSPTVFTLDSAFGTQLCRRGMGCIVFQNNLGGWRDTGTVRTIDKVDVVANKVTLSAAVGSVGQDDKLAFEGIASTPAWKNGLYLFNTSTTTGNILSLSRTDYPEVNCNEIAANGMLSGVHGMLFIDAVEQRRDADVVANMRGLAHSKQRIAWYKQGMAISEWQRGKADKMIDVVPDLNSREFIFAGINCSLDKHQDRTRIDFFVPKLWGRSILKELDWHTVEGRKLFEKRNTGVAAGMLFYLEQLEDWYCVDPGAAGFISGLTIPTVSNV